MMTVTGINEVKDWIEFAQRDLLLLADINDDSFYIEQLREIIANNFRSVWSSDGSIIGEDWDGHDLVRTGNLRNSLTTASRIRVTRVGSLVFFGSDVSYAEYVNDDYTFIGLSDPAQQAINNVVTQWLEVKGNLPWSS